MPGAALQLRGGFDFRLQGTSWRGGENFECETGVGERNGGERWDSVRHWLAKIWCVARGQYGYWVQFGDQSGQHYWEKFGDLSEYIVARDIAGEHDREEPGEAGHRS